MPLSHLSTSDIGMPLRTAMDRVAAVTELLLHGLGGLIQLLNIQSTNHLRTLWGRIVRPGYCQNLSLTFSGMLQKNEQSGSGLRKKWTIGKNLFLEFQNSYRATGFQQHPDGAEMMSSVKHGPQRLRCKKWLRKTGLWVSVLRTPYSVYLLSAFSRKLWALWSWQGQLGWGALMFNCLSLKSSLLAQVRYSRNGCQITNE